MVDRRNIRIKVVRFPQVRISADELELRRVRIANLMLDAINSVDSTTGLCGRPKRKSGQQYIDTLLLKESPTSPAHSNSMPRHT